MFTLSGLICPGALLSPFFRPDQCLGSFMSQLVPPLHSLKKTVFYMMCVVHFYICECVCMPYIGCVHRLEDNRRCWSPPSTLLQVCVGVISFLLFAAVYVRLAVYWGEGGGSPVFALCLGIAGILGLQRHTLAPRFPWVLVLVQQARSALSRLPVLPLVL